MANDILNSIEPYMDGQGETDENGFSREFLTFFLRSIRSSVFLMRMPSFLPASPFVHSTSIWFGGARASEVALNTTSREVAAAMAVTAEECGPKASSDELLETVSKLDVQSAVDNAKTLTTRVQMLKLFRECKTKRSRELRESGCDNIKKELQRECDRFMLKYNYIYEQSSVIQYFKDFPRLYYSGVAITTFKKHARTFRKYVAADKSHQEAVFWGGREYNVWMTRFWPLAFPNRHIQLVGGTS